MVGVSWHLATTELGLVKIKSALDRIILHKKLVYFLILTKNIPETEGDLSVVVQCVLCRKKKLVQENWDRRGYKLLSCSEPVVCIENSIFQVNGSKC